MSSVTKLSVAGSTNPTLCERGQSAACAAPRPASGDAANPAWTPGMLAAHQSRATIDCWGKFLSGTIAARICDGEAAAAAKVESERDDTRCGGACRRLADDGFARHQPREQRQAGDARTGARGDPRAQLRAQPRGA